MSFAFYMKLPNRLCEIIKNGLEKSQDMLRGVYYFMFVYRKKIILMFCVYTVHTFELPS